MDLHESQTQHCGFVNLRKCKIGICQMKSFSGFLFQGCLSFLPQSPPIPYGCLGKFSGVPIHSDQTDEVYWKQVACSMYAFKTILITSDTYPNADQLPNNPSIHPSIFKPQGRRQGITENGMRASVSNVMMEESASWKQCTLNR